MDLFGAIVASGAETGRGWTGGHIRQSELISLVLQPTSWASTGRVDIARRRHSWYKPGKYRSGLQSVRQCPRMQC